MRLLGIAGALVIAGLYLVDRGKRLWLASCDAAVKTEGAEFAAACAQTAENMSWLEAMRIGLGGTP